MYILIKVDHRKDQTGNLEVRGLFTNTDDVDEYASLVGLVHDHYFHPDGVYSRIGDDPEDRDLRWETHLAPGH